MNMAIGNLFDCRTWRQKEKVTAAECEKSRAAVRHKGVSSSQAREVVTPVCRADSAAQATAASNRRIAASAPQCHRGRAVPHRGPL
jgi:ssDNA-binding Zn-finger/Zn-ribbon topoisomerase 1